MGSKGILQIMVVLLVVLFSLDTDQGSRKMGIEWKGAMLEPPSSRENVVNEKQDS
jgi:hypothetical protein